MAKLKFDEIGKRFFETGVENCALYLMKTGTVTTGTSHYEAGVAWNGITSIEENPEGGEETILYADNIEYASLRSKEKYKATINAYMYPKEWAECDGSKAVITGVYAGQQTRRRFGLAYKTLIGDDINDINAGYKLHLVYNCSASVSSRSHQSVNDSPEAEEMSWEISANSVEVAQATGSAATTAGVKTLSTIVIDSRDFTDTAATKLKALEATLFGTDTEGSTQGTDPTLPDPDQVFDALD